MEIRGKQLHVEVMGPPNAPALLYLHGGPGGMGCYDFLQVQGAPLSNDLRVIAFDQRGTLRSEAYTEDESFRLQDMIDDCEAIRRALGISRWSVLGHSYGGYLAVLYALAHPEVVQALLLESPTFGFLHSERSILRKMAAEFVAMGDPENAAACLDLANGDQPPGDERLFALGSRLGERADSLLVHGEDKHFLNRMGAESGLPPQVWANSRLVRKKVLEEGSIYQSILPLLSSLAAPTLLMKGTYDPITCEEQVAAFQGSVPNGHYELFEASGHWIRVEETERYTQVVTEFVRQKTGNIDGSMENM